MWGILFVGLPTSIKFNTHPFLSDLKTIALFCLGYPSLNLPGIEQLGSFEWVNSVPEVQVTLLLPLLRASESEQVTSTTVPGTTGNCVVVLIVLFHSAFSPVQIPVECRYVVLNHLLNWLIWLYIIGLLAIGLFFKGYFDGFCCTVYWFCCINPNPFKHN